MNNNGKKSGDAMPRALDASPSGGETVPDNVKGGLWILNAAMAFSIVAVIIKLLGTHYHVMQILFVRQTIMGLMVAPIVVRDFPDVLKTTKVGLHLIRNCAALCAMGLGFTALAHLPLAQVTAISFARTFFITLFAILILSETVGVRRWSATAAGFIGVLVTLGPLDGGFNIYSVYAVMAAAAAGLVMNIIRLLSRTDRPSTILVYQIVFVGVVAAPFAWMHWQPPGARDWLLFLALGGCSVLGQMSNIHGFRIGEASAIVPFDYVRLIFAAVLGVLVFAEWPHLHTVLGAAIIVAAALYTWNRNRLHDKTKVRPGYGTAPRP